MIALLEEYLFPRDCGVCGRSLADSEEVWYGLCTDCRASLTITAETRCCQCGRPLISEQEQCLSCRSETPQYADQGAALFPYTGRYRDLLRAYKFSRHPGTGRFLAEQLIKGLALLPHSPAAVLVPVPPRPGKLKKIGWDQIRFLEKLLKQIPSSPPVYPCLKRLPSQTQKQLGRDSRKTNLLGKIRATRKVPPEVIVFDDIITTGSTINACAAALKDRGAQKVYGLCLFYT